MSGPDGGVDDLEEELSSSRVENEDSAVDRLRRQITFKSLWSKLNRLISSGSFQGHLEGRGVSIQFLFGDKSCFPRPFKRCGGGRG